MKNAFLKTLTLFLYFWISGILGFAQNSATDDQLLQIMKKECDRNYAILKTQETPVYLITYRLEEQKQFEVTSQFGIIKKTNSNHERIITIQIRIGDKSMDNYREIRNQNGFFYFFEDEIKIPITDDYLAIQQTLWRETEIAYRNAIKKYEQVKANSAVLTELEDKSPDFSDSQLESYYEKPITNVSFDIELWKSKLKSYTQPLLLIHDITSAEAFIRFTMVRKYFVSSEGNSIVQNSNYTHLFVSLDGKAEDGMEIPIYKSWFSFFPSELPSDQVVLNEVENLKNVYLKLRTAPVVDTYSGPALLSNDAAGVFFHEIFGHRVEGARMKSESDGQTFKKKVGESVLNPDVSIIFDPTIQYYKGVPLNGSYVFDDEGVRGERVVVVEKGILKNFLMTRTPIEGFPQSNGHARAQAGLQPVSRQSNLIVETQNPYTDAQLRKMLIDEIKLQGKEYGFFFKTVTGGFTITGRYIPNSFNVTPIEVYRVYADGRPDQLVRGVDLIGTPLAMFSQIGAIGDTPGNFAGTCGAESGGIPAGCCSPAVFVKRIELQKQSKSQEKPPLLQRPAEGLNSALNKQETIFRAMEDELLRNRIELTIPGLKRPYFLSYMVADANFISVNATLGGIIFSKEKPITSQETKIFVGNHKFNNLNFFDENSLFSRDGSISMPEESNYVGMRNTFWIDTDKKYKKAAESIESKSTAITQQNLSPELLNLPDYYPVDVNVAYLPNENGVFSLSQLENMGVQLSKIFEKYPNFSNSGVNLYAISADVYYVNSEGIKYKQPYSLMTLQIFAEARADDGEPIMDYLIYYFKNPEQLPTFEILTAQIKDLAERLEKLRTAPVITEIYSGPVMFVDDAVAEMFNSAFISDNNGILAGRRAISSVSETSQWISRYIPKENTSERLLNKKVISRNLSIHTADYLKTYNNTTLIGQYILDADGVTPDNSLSIIENGVLKNVLSNRIPTFTSKSSNGHQRMGFQHNSISTVLAPGVIMMSADKKGGFVLPYNKMKKRLIEMAKEEDYEYAYIVVKLPSSMANIPGINIYFGNEGYIRPIIIYRINVKDGSETLVRTTKMAYLKMKSFKHVSYVSKEMEPFNRMVNGKGGSFYGYDEYKLVGVPVSYILPKAIIFKELEVEKDDDILKLKEPLVPNPLKK